jgi:hypothetical protein
MQAFAEGFQYLNTIWNLAATLVVKLITKRIPENVFR